MLYDATRHPNNQYTSVYGINRLHPETFFAVFTNDTTDELIVQMGPEKKYHPTIAEYINFTWPASSIFPLRVYPSWVNNLYINVSLVPNREMTFNSKFVTFINYITTFALLASVLTGSPSATIRGSRILSITDTAECPLEDIEEPLPFSVHPLGLRFTQGLYSYHVGAAVCNTGLIILGFALTGAIGIYLSHRYPRLDTREVLAMYHWPSHLLAPCMLLFQPLMTSAAKLVYNLSSRVEDQGERSLGCLIIGFGGCFVAFLFWVMLSYNFGAEPRTTTSTSLLAIALRGKYMWKDHNPKRKFLPRYASVFVEYTPDACGFFRWELLFAMAFAGLGSPSLSNATRCLVVQSLTTLTFIAYLLLLLLMMPYQAQIKMLLFTVVAASDVVAVGMAYLNYNVLFAIVSMAAVTLSTGALSLVSLLNLYVQIRYEWEWVSQAVSHEGSWISRFESRVEAIVFDRKKTKGEEETEVFLLPQASKSTAQLAPSATLLGTADVPPLPHPDEYARSVGSFAFPSSFSNGAFCSNPLANDSMFHRSLVGNSSMVQGVLQNHSFAAPSVPPPQLPEVEPEGEFDEQGIFRFCRKKTREEELMELI